MVDCGPSRVLIWRQLQTESAMHIIAQLRSVVIEQGLCDELLLDNLMVSRSVIVAQFADEWGGLLCDSGLLMPLCPGWQWNC